MSKKIVLEPIEIAEQCKRFRKQGKGVHCVDLGESFPPSLYLQKSASIQPRTSPSKFGGEIMQYHSIVSEERRVAARHRFAGIRLFFLRAGFSRLARAGFSSQARERAKEATRKKKKTCYDENDGETRRMRT